MDIKRQIKSSILPLLHRHNFIDNIGIIDNIGKIDKKAIITIITIITAFSLEKRKMVIMEAPLDIFNSPIIISP